MDNVIPVRPGRAIEEICYTKAYQIMKKAIPIAAGIAAGIVVHQAMSRAITFYEDNQEYDDGEFGEIIAYCEDIFHFLSKN